jgi:hypothetical protein
MTVTRQGRVGDGVRPHGALPHTPSPREKPATRAYRSGVLPVVDFHNRRRPHTALGGRSPIDAVNDVLRDHT